MPLQVHILTNNHASTVIQTIASVSELKAEIVVTDLGSNDGTPKACRDLGAIVDTVTQYDDLSYVRNNAIGDGWILYLEPWEMLAAGQKEIARICQQDTATAYHVNVFQDETITKEVRLWHRNSNTKFVNPVFEHPQTNNSKFLDSAYSCGGKVLTDVETRVENWAKSLPIASEPVYYRAYLLMSKKRYPEFIQAAEAYLAQANSGKPATLMTYYLASVLFYIMEDTKQSVRNVLMCIASKPTMAEFWCLLGDIYHKLNKHEKAIACMNSGYRFFDINK